MTPEQEGGYIRLLCYAWADPDCSLPDDDQILSSLSRLNEGWFNGGSTVVRQCFKQVNGRLVNMRLVAEREKQRIWSEKSRQGGLKSAASRTSEALKGGSQMVEPNGNSSSSSSSSKEETPSECGAEIAMGKAFTKSQPFHGDNPQRRDFKRLWCSRFLIVHQGKPYTPGGVKDDKGIDKLLSVNGHTPEGLVDVAAKGWVSTNEFIRSVSVDISKFAGNFTSIQSSVGELKPARKFSRTSAEQAATYQPPPNDDPTI